MKNLLITSALLFLATLGNAQMGIGTLTPESSAILDLDSNDKGLLIPRMTESEKNAILSPVEGLMVYQSDGESGFYYYDGLSWTGMKNATDVVYAQLSDSTIQQPSTTDPVPVLFSTNDEIYNIGHVAGESTVTIQSTGVYNMVAQPQVNRNSNNGVVEFHCWFQKDTGSGWQDIPNSNILLDMDNVRVDDVIIVSLTTLLQTGDKIRIMMSTTDVSKDIRLLPQLNIPSEPNIPSIIFTMFRL